MNLSLVTWDYDVRNWELVIGSPVGHAVAEADRAAGGAAGGTAECGYHWLI